MYYVNILFKIKTMKKKYILKILSILPQFIYKRIIKKFFLSKYDSNTKISNIHKEQIEFYSKDKPPLDKFIFDNYFNSKISAAGVAVEFYSSGEKFTNLTKFFEESLGWDVLNLDYLSEKILISDFLKNNQITTLDLLVLDTENKNFEIISDLENTVVRPNLICLKISNEENWSNCLETLINFGYTHQEDISKYKIFLNKNVIMSQLALEENNFNDKKPIVNIISNIFQDSIYIESFFSQLNNLHTENYEIGKVYLSVDGSEISNEKFEKLIDDSPHKFEIKFDPQMNINPFRMEERARKWVHIFNQNIKNSLNNYSDFTIILEADLAYPSDVIDLLIESNEDIVAPIPILGNNFYDSWGFRKLDGEKIYDLKEFNQNMFVSIYDKKNLFELSSVGSFFCVKSEFLRKGIRLPPTYEYGHLVGFCFLIKKFGGKVFCRTDVSILHPTSYWKNQLWDVKLEISDDQADVRVVNKITPGLEDIFIEPLIMSHVENKVTYYIIEYFKEVKKSTIYCFSNKKYFNEKINILKSKHKDNFENLVYSNELVHLNSKYFHLINKITLENIYLFN